MNRHVTGNVPLSCHVRNDKTAETRAVADTSRARKALRATFENDGGLKHLFTLTYGFEVCNVLFSC